MTESAGQAEGRSGEQLRARLEQAAERRAEAAEEARGWGERVTSAAQEFIYGTLLAMVVLAGLRSEGEEEAGKALALVIVAAIATFLAHLYSDLVVRRLAEGGRMTGEELREASATSAGVLLGAVASVVCMLLAVAGVWEVPTGIRVALWADVAVLAAAGAWAARRDGLRAPRTLALIAANVVAGLVVVALEYLA